MLQIDPGQDPITTAWMTGIAILFAVAVVLPLARLVIATVIYGWAAVTGRSHLRVVAHRVMPRVGHLIGGLVVGTAAIAAPALAADTGHTPAGLNLDRDAGASAVADATGAERDSSTPDTSSIDTPSLDRDGGGVREPEQPSTGAEERAPHRAARHGHAELYVVRTGDTLWDIAEARMDAPTDADVTDAWKAIWRANRAVIGDHPDIIRPGQQLDLGGLE